MQEKLKEFLFLYKTELAKAGDQLSSLSMPELTEELFSEFELTGNRLNYENVYFMRRKFLSVYGILSILYGRERDIKKLEESIEAICREVCWALPAHVDRKNNKNWKITIDLFAAETGFSLAEIVGKLKGTLSEKLYKMVQREVFCRIIDPFMESEKPYAWWEESKINWCAVCNGSIGGAAIWLMEDKKQLDKLLDRVCASIMNYIDGFGEDGVCLEGLNYYTYGLSFFTAFADMVYQYSKGKMNLIIGKDKFKKIALFQQECFFHGTCLSFSDSSPKETFRVGLTAYLAMHNKDVIFPDFKMAAGLDSDPCYRYLMLSRDILFVQSYLEDKKQKINRKNDNSGSHKVFSSAQWSICRSSNDCALAVKGGHNAEPHNHNDVGSFLYVVCGKMILMDLGAGEYTKDYFNDKRYWNLCCRSLGHSVPMIDGMEQQEGKKHQASFFEANGSGKTIIGIERAYDLEKDERIVRTIDFHLTTGICKITDDFFIHKNRKITENLVSGYLPDIKGNKFSIKISQGRLDIHCPNGIGHTAVKKEYIDHVGKRKVIWLLQWSPIGSKAEISVEFKRGTDE